MVKRLQLAQVLPPLILGLTVLVAWQVGIKLFGVEQFVMPTPLEIIEAFTTRTDVIFRNAQATALEAVVGFVLGASVGAMIGTLIALSRVAERALLPYVVAVNTIPIVAVAPIVVLMLGEGISSKIVVTSFLCFFPVCLNTMKGLRSTPKNAIELMRINAASSLQEFRMVRVPAALPYAFVGLKLGATFSVIGAIVAEFVGATKGLGYLTVQSSYNLDTPMLWASMFASAVLGITLFLIVVLAERRFASWHDGTTL